MSRARTARRWADAAAALILAAGVLVLALPHVLSAWQLTADSIEYLGIAHSLSSGAGFVDPVVYSTYLPPQYPMPAAAIRPPLVPLLLAIPVGLGATIETTAVLHVLWASLVAIGVFLVARRWASLPSALAAAMGLCWAFGWIAMARLLLTEVTSVALVLALVAFAPRALGSVRGAATFAGLAFAAWLCRPNLALAVPALLTAALAGSTTWRRVIAAPPLWVCAGVFTLLVAGCSFGMQAATGLAPYAHHGLLLETVGAEDARLYQRHYVGAFSYLATHTQQVAHLLLWNLEQILRSFFLTPDYHYVGWLAVLAIARGLRARGAAAFERRFVAWFTLWLIPPAVLVPGSVDPMRLSLFLALGIWLLAADLFDAGIEWLAARLAAARTRTWIGFAPLALVLVVFACSPSARVQLGSAASAWRSYSIHGTQARNPWWARVSKLCPLLERDALVASPEPWSVYLWCGNAGIWLPTDLDSPHSVQRYLDEQAPGYVVVEETSAPDQISRSPRLERIAAIDGLGVYRLLEAPPRSRPWRAPPPLAARSAIPAQAGDVLPRRTIRVR